MYLNIWVYLQQTNLYKSYEKKIPCQCNLLSTLLILGLVGLSEGGSEWATECLHLTTETGINKNHSRTPHVTLYHWHTKQQPFQAGQWCVHVCVCWCKCLCKGCLCVCLAWLVRGMLWLTPGWAVTMDQLFHTAGKFQSDTEGENEREGDVDTKCLQLSKNYILLTQHLDIFFLRFSSFCKLITLLMSLNWL